MIASGVPRRGASSPKIQAFPLDSIHRESKRRPLSASCGIFHKGAPVTRDHDNRAASEESRLPVEPSIQGAVTGERVGDILRSIGEVAYEWDLQSDALSWGPNVREVLGIGPDIDIASGRLYAKLLDCGSTTQCVDTDSQIAVFDFSVRPEQVYQFVFFQHMTVIFCKNSEQLEDFWPQCNLLSAAH